LSSTFSLLNPEQTPLNLDEKSIHRFITEKIMKDGLLFMTADGGENYTKYCNKEVMKVKLNEFKWIPSLCKSYYHPKTLKYYFPRMFRVDDKRPDYTSYNSMT
jgi:hypothetical protein